MNNNIPFDPILPHNLSSLPPSVNLSSSKFADLLIKARVQLAELKGYSVKIPDQKLLLSPAILKESIASSGIENIHTTMMNVLENQLFPEQEQNTADKEVLRYKDAIGVGFHHLDKYSISTRTIQSLHKSLLTNLPGQYRENDGVVIGDSKTKKIIYTPPPVRDIERLMSNLEDFANTESTIDPLVRAAIIHYQFESIHPFSDGNGRAGRILMVLSLVKYGVLDFPTLYISGYLLKNRNEYYRRLQNVTINQEWDDYIEFMLNGFYLQAMETKELLFEIQNEYEDFKEKLKSKHRNIYNSVGLIDALFAYPIITASRLSEEVGCKWDTASNYLKTLLREGVLEDRKVGKYHFYMNKKLLDILYK